MSPFWIKTLLQVGVSAVKRWWNRKKGSPEEDNRKIIDEVNKAVNGRKQ